MKKNSYSVVFLRIFSIAGLFFAASACNKETKVQIPPLDVKVVTAQKEDVPVYYDFVGQVLGASDIDINARVDGWITGKYFQEGSFVKAGQLLYTLDDEALIAQLEQAQGNLASAQTEVVRASNQLSRVKPLVEKNALSQQDLDNATAAYDAALAQKQAAEGAVLNAKVQLGYTKIYAPISGIIGISNVYVGDYVQRISSGPLTMISQISSVKVHFQVSENDFIRYEKAVQAGQKFNTSVSLILPDNTEFGEKGRINFANAQIDSKTGTITMEAEFTNKGGLLRSGMYVKVHMLLNTQKGVTLIPQKAVSQLQNKYQVYVIDSNSVLQTKIVSMGQKVGDAWIVESGLKPGDGVALVGGMIIKPGAVVLPVKTAWTPVLTNQ